MRGKAENRYCLKKGGVKKLEVPRRWEAVRAWCSQRDEGCSEVWNFREGKLGLASVFSGKRVDLSRLEPKVFNFLLWKKRSAVEKALNMKSGISWTVMTWITVVKETTPGLFQVKKGFNMLSLLGAHWGLSSPPFPSPLSSSPQVCYLCLSLS